MEKLFVLNISCYSKWKGALCAYLKLTADFYMQVTGGSSITLAPLPPLAPLSLSSQSSRGKPEQTRAQRCQISDHWHEKSVHMQMTSHGFKLHGGNRPDWFPVSEETLRAFLSLTVALPVRLGNSLAQKDPHMCLLLLTRRIKRFLHFSQRQFTHEWTATTFPYRQIDSLGACNINDSVYCMEQSHRNKHDSYTRKF